MSEFYVLTALRHTSDTDSQSCLVSTHDAADLAAVCYTQLDKLVNGKSFLLLRLETCDFTAEVRNRDRWSRDI